MKHNNITQQSTQWEMKNSLYILLAFIWAGYVGFFYIGRKAKQKKWVITGLIYAVIIFVSFFGMCWFPDHNEESVLYDISMAIVFFYWPVTLIHLFAVRKEYLLRLEALQAMGADTSSELKKRIKNEYTVVDSESTTPSINHKSAYENIEPNIDDVQPIFDQDQLINANIFSGLSKIDINNCSEEELSKLPGVSLSLAKKAIQYRNKNGGYNSADELFQLLELKPHFVAQLRDYITCGEVNNYIKTDRKLDI
ncbi:MAG: helix-hairpin-helix domain-containing protein [Clostridia bacterium]|nr:helix-hairpin-helix domain-containing protein [Clostridia bacterium]